jgi:hypothetical protein
MELMVKPMLEKRKTDARNTAVIFLKEFIDTKIRKAGAVFSKKS